MVNSATLLSQCCLSPSCIRGVGAGQTHRQRWRKSTWMTERLKSRGIINAGPPTATVYQTGSPCSRKPQCLTFKQWRLILLGGALLSAGSYFEMHIPPAWVINKPCSVTRWASCQSAEAWLMESGWGLGAGAIGALGGDKKLGDLRLVTWTISPFCLHTGNLELEFRLPWTDSQRAWLTSVGYNWGEVNCFLSFLLPGPPLTEDPNKLWHKDSGLEGADVGSPLVSATSIKWATGPYLAVAGTEFCLPRGWLL